MADQDMWEYRVQTFGSAFREAKDQEILAILNAWGQEGWEVVSAAQKASGKVTVIAKRPLGLSERRRRSWPT